MLHRGQHQFIRASEVYYASMQRGAATAAPPTNQHAASSDGEIMWSQVDFSQEERNARAMLGKAGNGSGGLPGPSAAAPRLPPLLPSSSNRKELREMLTREQHRRTASVVHRRRERSRDSVPALSPSSAASAEAALRRARELEAELVSHRATSPPPLPPPPPRPPAASRHGAILKRRGVADRASTFYCKHPGCDKSYGCPDAVRKHCRKQHNDWLRSLGNVGPTSYCWW